MRGVIRNEPWLEYFKRALLHKPHWSQRSVAVLPFCGATLANCVCVQAHIAP